MIEIDGSYGEGGGQIVRTALSLAAIMGKPVRVANIRAKRKNPGLRPQHLSALKAIAHVSGGRIDGLKIGSMEVAFHPGEILSGGNFSVNIGTAGSISLVIQCILPVLMFSRRESNVSLTGGTDVKWSPTIDYMKEVFTENLRVLGLNVEINTVRRGYYPRGGGIVNLSVKPVKKIRSVKISRVDVDSVEITSVCSNLPKHVAERQADSAVKELRKFGVEPSIVKVEALNEESAIGRGSSILVKGVMVNGFAAGGDSVGERGKPAEVVGREAAERFLEWFRSDASVDIHLGDMLVPYASLAESETNYTVTEKTGHILSSLYVQRETIGATYKLADLRRNLVLVKIKGIGFKNKFILNGQGDPAPSGRGGLASHLHESFLSLNNHNNWGAETLET